MKTEVVNNDALTVRVNAEPVKQIIDEMESTLDVVEEAIQRQSAEVVEVVRNNPRLLVGVGLLGLAVGGFIGYKVAARRLEKRFEDELHYQVEKAKEFYGDLAKARTLVDDESVPVDVRKAVQAYQGYEPPERVALRAVQEKIETTTVEVEDWDYDTELASRAELDPRQPYVISKEEFLENESEMNQHTLTYFVGDNTLADDKDEIIPAVEMTVGEDNLTRFGHGSGQEHVVYIRNPRLDLEFEVVRSTGKYSVEVAGFVEQQPEERARPRRRNRGTDG